MTSRSVALWGRSVPAPDGQKRYHNLANSSTPGGAWLKANKPDQELGLPPADGVEESKSRGWRTSRFGQKLPSIPKPSSQQVWPWAPRIGLKISS